MGLSRIEKTHPRFFTRRSALRFLSNVLPDTRFGGVLWFPLYIPSLKRKRHTGVAIQNVPLLSILLNSTILQWNLTRSQTIKSLLTFRRVLASNSRGLARDKLNSHRCNPLPAIFPNFTNPPRLRLT